MRYLQQVNEWFANEKKTKFELSKFIKAFQSKAKQPIKNSQFRKEETDRYTKYEFSGILEHQLFEKVLKSYQKLLINSGIYVAYKKVHAVVHTLGHDLSISNTRLTNTYDFTLYVKDIFTERVMPPKVVYHYTSKEHRDDISTNGLKLHSWDKGNWTSEGMGLSYPPSIFATTEEGGWYANASKQDVWEIDTRGCRVKWWKDLNFHNTKLELNKTAIMTFESIPAEYLTLVKK